MNKAIPAVLAFAAVIASAPARPVAAQDAAAPAAAGAQANDPEAQAAEAYKTWKAETDPARSRRRARPSSPTTSARRPPRR